MPERKWSGRAGKSGESAKCLISCPVQESADLRTAGTVCSFLWAGKPVWLKDEFHRAVS